MLDVPPSDGSKDNWRKVLGGEYSVRGTSGAYYYISADGLRHNLADTNVTRVNLGNLNHTVSYHYDGPNSISGTDSWWYLTLGSYRHEKFYSCPTSELSSLGYELSAISHIENVYNETQGRYEDVVIITGYQLTEKTTGQVVGTADKYFCEQGWRFDSGERILNGGDMGLTGLKYYQSYIGNVSPTQIEKLRNKNINYLQVDKTLIGKYIYVGTPD